MTSTALAIRTTTDVEPFASDTLPEGDVTLCACGTLIAPTGKRGRPAKRCEACRAAEVARKAEARVTRCKGVLGKGCGRILTRKGLGRGRPTHICPTCKAQLAASKVDKREMSEAVVTDRGYCNDACMFAQGAECSCPCEGRYHQAGLVH